MLLETDYLVVGAGATGLAFVDTLVAESDVHVTMVDCQDRPGGHWLHAYPFIRLHSPSAFYGVNSLGLGENRVDQVGENAGFYERASGREVTEHFAKAAAQLTQSGRVNVLMRHEHLAGDGDGAKVRDLGTGNVHEVAVRRRVVDARYLEASVPATHSLPFEVAESAQVVPINDLPAAARPDAAYAVLGSGKTAVDACVWLLDNGVEPHRIKWIRPREAWFYDRRYFQPLDQVAAVMEGVSLDAEAGALGGTVDEMFERLEAAGRFVRIDPTLPATMYRGTMLSAGELHAVRQIEDVVRLGRVRRIEPDRIVLERGSVPTTPDHLHVHCAASGLSDNPPRPIFADDTITLQLVTRVGITLSGGLQGFLESTGRTTEEKNRLCPPTAMPHTPFDYMRVVLAGVTTEMGWQEAPELQAWVDHSRLNLLSGLGEHEDDAHVSEIQRRFFDSLFPALEKLQVFAAEATPRERARIFQPAASVDA